MVTSGLSPKNWAAFPVHGAECTLVHSRVPMVEPEVTGRRQHWRHEALPLIGISKACSFLSLVGDSHGTLCAWILSL